MTVQDLNFLAYSFMLLSPEKHLLIAYSAFVFGGLLGALVWRGETTLNRSRFLLGVGANSLLLASVQVVWLFWTELLLAGVVFVILLVELLIVILSGIVLCGLARARSLDASDNTRWAWLAFVKPFGLLLLVLPSRNPGSLRTAVPIYAVAIVLLVIGRVAPALIGGHANERMHARMEEPAVIFAYNRLAKHSIDTEAELQALVSGPRLPTIVGNMLILTAITRDALHVTYNFTFDPSLTGSGPPATAADMKAHYCDIIGPQMDKGATVTLVFTGKGAPSATPIELDAAACAP